MTPLWKPGRSHLPYVLLPLPHFPVSHRLLRELCLQGNSQMCPLLCLHYFCLCSSCSTVYSLSLSLLPNPGDHPVWGLLHQCPVLLAGLSSISVHLQ